MDEIIEVRPLTPTGLAVLYDVDLEPTAARPMCREDAHRDALLVLPGMADRADALRRARRVPSWRRRYQAPEAIRYLDGI